MLQKISLFSIMIMALLPLQVINWCKETYFQTGKAINCMAVSPNGRYLGVAHSDNFVRIYHGENYILLGSYNVGFTINVIRFSNDGYYLAIGGASSTVTVLNGYEPFSLNSTLNSQVGSNVVGIDFSNDSTKFIACGGSGSGAGKLSLFTVSYLTAWASVAPSPVNMNPSSSSPNDCRISPFNGHIAVDIASKITIYDSVLATSVSYTAGTTTYSKIVFDPLSAFLLYIDLNGNQFYNLQIATGTATTLTGPNNILYTSDFSSNGKYISTGGVSKILYIYDSTRTSAERWNTTDQIRGVAFNRDPFYSKLYVGQLNGQVLVLALNCSNVCPPNYYYNASCLFCGDSLSKCVDCLNSTVCHRCVDGYYVDPSTTSCKVCPLLGCLTCITATNCTECHSGFYKVLSGSTYICKRCSQSATLQGCAICNSSAICTACNNDYYLDTTNNVCKICTTISNCLKCNNVTNCTECIIGYYELLGVCTACDSNCISCFGSATNCSQCAKGWYVNMPTSYICTRCQTGCLACNNSNFCLECTNGMYEKTDGSCDVCPFPCINCQDASTCNLCSQGYYLTGTACTPCINNCATCNSTAYCSSCLPGYYWSAGACTACMPAYPNCEYCSATACQSCQPGYFLNSTTLCQHCSLVMFKCEKCTSLSNCLSCIEGFYHSGLTGNLSCKSCPSGCQTCQDGTICRKCYPNFYLDSNNACTSCPNNCLQCTDLSTCTVCDSGYYVDTGACKLCKVNLTNCLQCNNGTSCINCMVGFYLNPSDSKCIKCSGNCINCNDTKCFSCQIGYFLTATASPICQVCSQTCTECTALATCTSCKIGYYLDTSTCKSCSINNKFCQTCNNLTCYSCLYGYYLDNTISPPNYNCTRCLAKIEGCLHCNATNYCLSCDYGYYLDAGTNLCVSCTLMNGCEKCSDSLTCQVCGTGFYLNATNQCQVCKPGCSSCNPTGDCFTCYPGYYLAGTTCSPCKTSLQGCALCPSSAVCSQCMNGYYLSGVTFKCELCRSVLVGCFYCNDSLTCTSCQPGFYLDAVNHNCSTCSKNMAGCQICSTGSVCLDCEVGYYLAGGGGSGCALCTSSLTGCLSCSDINTCQLCKTGFYLHSDNKCHTCSTVNGGCEVCASNGSGGITCQKCSASFYLNTVTNLCVPCGTVGCGVCNQLSPTTCLTCESMYYKSGTSCIKCNTAIQGCKQCSISASCMVCDVGYYLDTNGKCILCQDAMGGCGKCKVSAGIFECQDCKSSYILESVTKTCKTCFSVLEGCTYCVNSTECVSCANGYFKDSTTNLCRSCTEQAGCLLCTNQTSCEYCAPSFFMDQTASKCKKCSSVIEFCLTCLQPTRCLSCQSGYIVNSKFQCEQVTVTATDKVQGVKLITEYVDKDTLGHTLFVKNDQYQNIGYNLTGKCNLYLTDYNQLTATKKIVQVQLIIKDIKWLSPNKLIFYTDNPTSLTADSMSLVGSSTQSPSQITNTTSYSPRLLSASISNVGNFKVSLQMTQQAVNSILPNIYQTGNMILDYSLNEPQFYISYLRYQGSNAAYYSLFGYIVTCILLLNFIYKTYKLSSTSEQTHHYTGQVLSHVFAIKSISLFHYPITYQLYYFCYGFMLADLPWLNYQIGPVLGERSDYVPTQFVMYYFNLNLASTYLLSLCVFVILLCLRFVINKNKEFVRNKYSKFIYSIFIFGMTYAGSLSLQGAVFNPIKQVSINALFYLLGILLYLSILIQLIYSINSNKNNLYKVRIFTKATLLSIGHLNPIIVVSVAIITDILLIIFQFIIIETNVSWNKFWLANHLALDLSLTLMFVLPNSLLSLIATIIIVSIVLIVELLLNFKLMTYCELKKVKQNQPEEFGFQERRREKLKGENFFGKNNESLQTMVEDKEIGKYNMWNIDRGEFGSLNDLAVQDERVGVTRKQFYQASETKYTSFEIKHQKGHQNDINGGYDIQEDAFVRRKVSKGRRVSKKVHDSKDFVEQKKLSNPFRIENSSSSSPTEESVNSNEDKDKKKPHVNFLRSLNKVPMRQRKGLFQQ